MYKPTLRELATAGYTEWRVRDQEQREFRQQVRAAVNEIGGAEAFCEDDELVLGAWLESIAIQKYSSARFKARFGKQDRDAGVVTDTERELARRLLPIAKPTLKVVLAVDAKLATAHVLVASAATAARKLIREIL
jgi:hypothetical protein